MELDEAWAVLGHPSGADRAVAERRFRELARQWHPDFQAPAQRDAAHDRMIRLNRAREVLREHDWCPPQDEPFVPHQERGDGGGAAGRQRRDRPNSSPPPTRRMSKAQRQAFNRRLAAAMRAKGVEPSGEAWERAKREPQRWGVDPSSP